MSGADPRALLALRRLAQLSILFATLTLLATAAALVELPNAVASGQWILSAAGGLVSLTAFLFGALLSLRHPLARPVGFLVVALVVPTAALFGLIALAVPNAAWMLASWTAVLVAYAIVAAHRLVRWPTADAIARPKSRLGIFISYRRDDSRETVGRIHDHLIELVDDKTVFLDVEDQAAGEDYRAVIRRELDHARIMLVVIGPQWLTATDRGGRRRLDTAGDLVRIEVETGLDRGLRVIPILIEGVGMPTENELPESLRPLCYKTAMPVRPDPDFKTDMQRLFAALGLGDSEAAATPVVAAR